MIFLPYLLSCMIGILLVHFFLIKEKENSWFLKLVLGCGLGLAVSSHLTFYGFLLYTKLCPELTINSHGLLLIGLLGWFFYSLKNKGFQFILPKLNWKTTVILALYSVGIFLVIKAAYIYPKGGWDAWQVWNFKAKFLFLAGENWQNLFDPDLWRTSPHYPLLLPFINVWVWLINGKADDFIPLATSVLFTLLTAGIVSAGIWQNSRNHFSALAGLLLLTLPLFNLLATSQYCDIVLSFYLLGAIITLGESLKKEKTCYALLAGLFTGFMSFTKPEGMVAALLIVGMVMGLWFWSRIKNPKLFSTANCGLFILALVVASVPTIAFHYLYSPGNQTFVNGFTSADKPATIERLQTVLMFLFAEFKNAKWGWLWFLVLLGIVLGGKNSWTGKNAIAGIFLILYLLVIVAYYQLNTYFEIKWWLSVSLNRILFSLLPLALYWAFSGILKKRN